MKRAHHRLWSRPIAGAPHPELPRVITTAGENATLPAALLGERDILQKSGQSDFTKRIQAIVDADPQVPKPTRNRIKSEAKRLTRFTGKNDPRYSLAQMLALAFPGRIGHGTGKTRASFCQAAKTQLCRGRRPCLSALHRGD